MAELNATFACAPATERGRNVLLGGHAETETIAYCSGKNVYLRSLTDPMKVTVYTEHQHQTTVARYNAIHPPAVCREGAPSTG